MMLLILMFIFRQELPSQPTNQQIDSLIEYAGSISSSKHKVAYSMLDSVVELARKNNYKRGEAEAMRRKGLALFYAIDYDEALKLFLESKKKFQDINDYKGIGDANNMIAITYAYHGMTKKAYEIHKENLEIRKKANDSSGISATLNNIGVELKNLDRQEEAVDYYKKAIELEKRLKDSVALSRYYDNLGSIYLDMNKPNSSIIYYKKSLEIREKINDRQGIKNIYEAMGDYHSYFNDYIKAKEWYEKSYEIAKEIDIVYETESITYKLANTYEKLNDYKNAHKFAMLANAMNDSMFYNRTDDILTSIEVKKAIASEKKIQQLEKEKLEIQKNNEIAREKNLRYFLLVALVLSIIIVVFAWYGLTQKRKLNKELMDQQDEIMAQNEEIMLQHEAISAQNDTLRRINSEKDRFFSIIAHDLKSPFSGFLGLTKDLVEAHDILSSEEIKEYAESMQDSANHLYKLLENLLEWSRIQRGTISFNREQCNLKLLVEQNINIQYQVANQKGIELIDKVPEDVILMIDVPMINTVFRNFLSNSIKFSNPGGKIEIGITNNEHINENFVEIYVKDNGIGMDENIRNNLFKIDKNVSRPGTNDEPSTGLGLLLCKDFIEKHNGTVHVESAVGEGSTFYFSLPKE